LGTPCLLLIGVTALLPWLVEASVARLRGGPLPWQLATRRLQLNSGAATRAVSGITIAVAGAEVMLRLDRFDPDALERVRNTAAHIDPAMDIRTMLATKTDSNYAAIQNGLLIGAIAILVLIGASMIVSTLEQLRERRRLLSVLVPIVGAGAAVIALVTLASLPPLWHLMRPDGLRTE
jgi:hypothetical protein